MSLFLKLDSYRRLGLKNLGQVFWYTLKLKSGWLKYTMPISEPIKGPLFSPLEEAKLKSLSAKFIEMDTIEEPQLLGWYDLQTDSIPVWYRSILTDRELPLQRTHWSDIADFSSGIGDIKGLWELSRFNWVLVFVLNYIKYQDTKYLNKFNTWIEDWSLHNPANQGPNWKCAQEASIRVLHLAACALVMEQTTPNAAMQTFLREHLARIYPTLGYAMAQDNNHGTSEAAALYVGGSWLLQADADDEDGKRWKSYGQDYLVERVLKLVMEDGSFSQYSVNYHRLMLDTLSLAELWRRALGLKAFSRAYQHRAGRAANWLFQFTDPDTGDVPNLGANDGAHIANFTGSKYRDYRPSVDLAVQLFLDKSAYPESSQVRNMFGLSSAQTIKRKDSLKFPDGGYGVIRQKQSFCMLRVPVFRFRPGQSDCLHVDFWLYGSNILRDGGSYSYNTQPEWLNYFSGSASHNTIQFDEREAMPKVSRFLFGKWLNPEYFNLTSEENTKELSASYIDWLGVTHSRKINLSDNQLVIVDDVTGFNRSALLRWRLAPKKWIKGDNTLTCDNIKITLSSESLISFNLAEGFESRYYGKKEPIPVLEVKLAEAGRITTIISWA